MLSRPASAAAAGFLALVVLVALFAPWIAPHDPTLLNVAPPLSPSGPGHLLGTDDLGRDILSRLMYAARLSIAASFATVGIALVLALFIGLVAGYSGGWVDNVLMRITDAGLSFPPLVLALAVAGILGAGLDKIILALAVVFTPGLARLIRGQTLAIREETYVEASRTIGTPRLTILRHRVLPNLRSPLIVSVSFYLGTALLAEAGLSYLGLGARPPEASWGNMLRRAYDHALFTEPWQLVIPGLAITLTVLSFTVLADGLRRVLGGIKEPRMQRGEKRGLTVVDRAEVVTEPAAEGTALRVRDLAVRFAQGKGHPVVEGVDLDVPAGSVVGVVGESGSGKSVTLLSVLRLLPPAARLTAGRVQRRGRDLLGMSFEEIRAVRGGDISMIFQDPMTSLDPARTIGSQVAESVRLHSEVDRATARERAREMLERVGIPAAAERLDDYPHQMSGGMRQRVMIAMALACRPRVLLADEPTTALDVTIQAQILDVLRDLQRELDFAVVLVTHDLGVVSDLCDRVVVMYAGEVVEEGLVTEVFARPRHPYTAGLLGAMPQVGRRNERLTVIPGTVPALDRLPSGCRFRTRCIHARALCAEAPVPLTDLGGGDRVRCRRHTDLDLEGAR
ncbi:dipeptide/oligopeptide/nickel ABC transporter permease/ATP-binding protein [Pseudonocardia lutea]|uniref:Dipeptide/oligopeptide/nickel ABC transporter permease/ATP-binding protein n=1 Tax=Pseudonocardia lutea TaxID=2172015 RepID=A0ABW1IFD7_9PSEU